MKHQNNCYLIHLHCLHLELFLSFLALINKYKAVQASFKRAEYFVNVSYDALGIFQHSEEKKILQNLTEFSLNRSF